MEQEDSFQPFARTDREAVIQTVVWSLLLLSIALVSWFIWSAEYDAPHLLLSLPLFIGLVALIWYDLRRYRLPNLITYALILAGLGINAWYGLGTLCLHLLGAGIGYGLIWVLNRFYVSVRHREGIGMGDAKLVAASGAWLGPFALAPVLMLSSAAGILLLLIYKWKMMLDTDQKPGADLVPFGPALCLGFWIVYFAWPVFAGKII